MQMEGLYSLYSFLYDRQLFSLNEAAKVFLGLAAVD